jgi:hypothetical protein
MTVALFAAGGLLAGLGTRASALAFVAAAVSGARQPQPLLAALTTWTSALAAGWVLMDRRPPRSLAVPCLGAAAVLAAAGSPNGAVVLGLWVIGTIAAVLSRGDEPSASRWALGLAAGDVIFAVAIATTAGRGFEGWPSTLKLPAALAILVAAALRIPLLAGPSPGDGRGETSMRRFASCLILRAQLVVLIGLAIAASGDRTLVRAVVILGAVSFAVSVLARRSAVDAFQEAGLVAMTIGGSALGWIPSGWAWGALAAGTLIHHLRFSLEAPSSGAFADAIARGGGVGLPFLPVSAALLEGAFAASSRLATIMLVAIVCGFAGRTYIGPASLPLRRRPAHEPERLALWAPVIGVGAACVAAPLLSLPRPPGGGTSQWLGVWGAAAVLIAAAAGSQMRGVVPTPRDVDRDLGASMSRAIAERVSVLDVIATDAVLWATLTAVAAAGVLLWVIGLGRGFL